MPKKDVNRKIDTHVFGTAPIVIGGPNTGGTGGVTDHGNLTGLTDDDHPQYYTQVRGDARWALRTTTVTAGAGLTGGGALTGPMTLDVGAGTLITVAANTVGVSPGTSYQFVGTGSGTAAGWRDTSELAGSGLVPETGALAVGAGTLITVAANTVGVSPGASYQFIGTGSGTAASWRNVTELAGMGLDSSAGELNVGQGNGVIVGVNAVTLAVSSPNSDLSVSSTSAVTADGHTHVVTASNNVSSAQTALLKAVNGALTLDTYTATTHVRTPLINAAASITLSPTTAVLLADTKPLFSVSQSGSYPTTGFTGSGLIIEHNRLYSGKAYIEVDNLTVRGQLNVYELLIHQIRATNGSVIVANTGKIWSRSLHSGSEGVVGSQYTLNTEQEQPHGFAVNDLIRAQRWTGNGTYQSDLQVVGVFSSTNFRAQLVAGPAPQVGYEYVRLGNTTDTNRQGGIYMTADDTGAPFLDVWYGVSAFSDWNNSASNVVKVRLGRLDGVSSGSGEFGIVAGNNGFGTNASWFKISNLGAELRNLNIRIYSSGVQTGAWTSEGTLALSDVDIGTSDNRAFWFHPTTPSLRVGKLGTNKPNLWYDGSALHLRQNATPVITLDGSGDSYFAGVMTIGTSGEIRQGSGTLGSDFTGLRIWRSGSVGLIGGYNNNVVQWTANTSGVLTAGAGAVTLSATGIDVAGTTAYSHQRAYSVSNGGTVFAGVGGFITGGYSYIQVYAQPHTTNKPLVELRAEGTASLPGKILVTAFGDSAPYFQVDSDGNGSILAWAQDGDVTLRGATVTLDGPVTADSLDVTGATSLTGTLTVSVVNHASGVNLRYNGSTKIATTSTGVSVTGDVTASGVISANTGVSVFDQLALTNMRIGSTNYGGIRIAYSTAGAWSRGLNFYDEVFAASYGAWAAYGASPSTFTYLYAGKAFNDTVARLDPATGRSAFGANTAISSTATINLSAGSSEHALVITRASGQASVKGSGAASYLVLDSADNSGLVALNYYTSANVVLAYGGGNVGIGKDAVSARLHVDGVIRSAGAISGAGAVFTTDASFTLADSATQVLWTSSGAVTHVTIINASSGQVWTGVFRGSAGTLTQFNSSGAFTTTQGTNNNTNIYYSSPNYLLENKHGVNRTYRVFFHSAG